MKRLLWISDAHLDHLSPRARRAWFDVIEGSNADMLLLGGDLTVAPLLTSTLRKIVGSFGGEVLFVAGNHDYYGGDTSGVRAALSKTDGVIAFEPGCRTEPLPLESDVFLCGSGGWGDAQAGTASEPVMPLCDETFIADLGERKLATRLGQFGCLSARHLLRQLNMIPPTARHVIILTHVPPWAEATWHGGHPAYEAAQARYCWEYGGRTIRRFARSRQETRFTVLCGHTHSGGTWKSGNIICHTAASCYRVVMPNAVIRVGRRINVRRLDLK
ncbi:MAG: metallophosphoesterase family protein [Terrimicrobiaceae bacterium]